MQSCPYHHSGQPAVDRAQVWQGLHEAFDQATTVLLAASQAYAPEFADYAARLPIAALPVEAAPVAAGARYHFASEPIASFVTAQQATTYDSGDFQPLKMPVGTAGEQPARRRLTSVAWLAQLCDRPVPAVRLNAVADAHASVLRAHTFRGVASGDARAALRNGLQQGVAAIGHAHALLTLDVTPDEIYAVEQRLAGNPLQSVARAIGSGAVSGLMRQARYIPRALRKDASPSQQLSDFLTVTRTESRAQAEQSRRQEAQLTMFDAETHLAAAMGTTCPATKGPIARLSRVIVQHGEMQQDFSAYRRRPR